MRLRKRVVFERFLARLIAARSEGWALKGAFAIELRLGLRTRTTKDIDVAFPDDREAATEHLNAASAVDLGDFFSFEARRTSALDAAAGFRAVRYAVRAGLAGRRFEQFSVDVAFNESFLGRIRQLQMPNSLEFAAVAAPLLPVVALEQHVAEKFHAYTGAYGLDGRESTRVKDLVDLALIDEVAELDANRLSRALKTIFERRASQPLPPNTPPPPASWATPYARLAREVGIAADIDRGHAAAARLLDPVLTAIASEFPRD
jgi:Nucleotidyl transferase AbiEii toxin, Type IV TA system